MRKTLLYSLLLAVWLFSTAAWAQRTVTGTVTSSEDNSTLPGVNVVLKGTTVGIQTDITGNYTLSVPDDPAAVLTFSFIGFTSQDRAIGTESSINIKLQVNVNTLDEALVVGYGIQTRKQITGSVSTIRSDAFENIPTPSLDQALQGRAAGVQINQSAGTPGAATRVRIRGQQSISGTSDPLYVIDGIIITNDDISSKNYGATSAISLNPLASINPNDIESVEVLKDASAAAIYGARAANGVIIVTTKRGKNGKGEITVDYNHGVITPARVLKLTGASDFKNLFLEGYANDSVAFHNANTGAPTFPFPSSINGFPVGPNGRALASNADRINYFKTAPEFSGNTNWLDDVFRTGSQDKATVTFRQGSEKLSTYLSADYLKQKAFLKGNDFDRLSIRTNIDNKLTDYLSVGLSGQVSYTDNKQVKTSYNGGLGAAQAWALPIFPVYNADGSFNGTQLSSPNTTYNPAAQRQDIYETTNLRTLGNIYAEIRFAPWLRLRDELGADIMSQGEAFIYSPVNRYYQNKPFGGLDQRRVNYINLNNNLYLTFDKLLLRDRLRTQVVAGTNVQQYTQADVGFSTQSYAGFTDPSLATPDLLTSALFLSPQAPANSIGGGTTSGYSSSVQTRFLSYFLRPNFTFLDRYVVQGAMRVDGSSNFGPNKHYGFFWSLGSNWIFTEEAFLKDKLPWLNAGKLRASFGKVGSASLGSGQYAYSANLNYQSPAYQGQQGLDVARVPNPDLSWEKVNQIDLGIELTFLKGRLSTNFGYYDKYTPFSSPSTLLAVPLQQSATGFGNQIVNSRARVRNYGFELEISSKNFISSKNGFTWSTDLNVYTINNKLLYGAGIPPDGVNAGIGDGRAIEGQPLGVSYLMDYQGIDPATGYPVIRTTPKHVTRDGKDVYFPDSLLVLKPTTPTSVFGDNRKPVGSPFPKFAGGLTNTFGFKGVTLSVLAVFQQGNTIYDDGGKFQNNGFGSDGQNGYWNTTERYRDGRWTAANPNNATFSRATLHPFAPASNNSTQWLYKGDYIRIRSIELAYNFPPSVLSKLKISGLRVYAIGQNMFTFTRYPGWDPEVVRYADAGSSQDRANQSNLNYSTPYLPTPQARTIILGLTVRI